MSPDIRTDPDLRIEHRSFTLDGVRVEHFPSQDTVCRATLVFGVGHRDETLPTLGTLHALEHLVMDTVRRTPIDIDAEVDGDTTQFMGHGNPLDVGRFLTGVCRALTDPPVHNLAKESRVLAAELGSSEGAGMPLLTGRFGWRDAALTDAPGPGPEGIVAEVVGSAAARWFTSGNAVLLLDGPWPEGLRLPLPGGSRPDRSLPPVRSWPSPHAITVDDPVCAVSLILPKEEASRMDAVAVELIDARLTDALRYDGGFSYDVDITVIGVSGHRMNLIVDADPRPDELSDAARVLVQTVRTLLASGPTAAELETAVERVLEEARGRNAHIDQVMTQAVRDLFGEPRHPLDPERLRGLTPEDLTTYLRGLAADVLYLAAEESTDALGALGVPFTTIEPPADRRPTPGRTFRPPALALLLYADARSSRVTLSDTGLILASEDQVQAVDFDQVAGVMRVDDDELVVFGLDGSAIPIGGGLYKGGQQLVDAVLRHVSADLVYQQSALVRVMDDD